MVVDESTTSVDESVGGRELGNGSGVGGTVGEIDASIF
jgi:hypothetical protein